MKATIRGNVFTVTTGITKEIVDSSYSAMKARDEKGNELYGFFVSANGKGNMDRHHIECNTVIDGEFAYTATFPLNTTAAEIKAYYAEAVLAAAKYLPIIAQEVQLKAETIDGLFEVE